MSRRTLRKLTDQESARHVRLIAKTSHCGREICATTLPHPDAWEEGLETFGDSFCPECVCPCLRCHPADSEYKYALYVIEQEYGFLYSLAVRAARRIHLWADAPKPSKVKLGGEVHCGMVSCTESWPKDSDSNPRYWTDDHVGEWGGHAYVGPCLCPCARCRCVEYP